VKFTSIDIARLSLIVALTLILQAFGLPQPITGPLINAILFLTTALFGWLSGLLVGLLTPGIAFFRGQLPPVLAPMLPFIAAGNACLVLIYYFFFRLRSAKSQVSWIDLIPIVIAAAGKFIILFTGIRVILPAILGKRFPPPFEFMMAVPQLLTAFGGGILFLLFHRIIHKTKPSHPPPVS
jgi:uncharacterized membrane protein